MQANPEGYGPTVGHRIVQTYVTGGEKPTFSMVGVIMGRRNDITGDTENNPLLISLGGPSGAGKTELAALYAQEKGLGYNIKSLAKQADTSIDLVALREELNLTNGETIYARHIPKFNTRVPRPGEHDGIDAYFISFGEMQKRERGGEFLFAYDYPTEEGGNRYGVPKSVLWPLREGHDSVVTFTGFDSFAESFGMDPRTVPVWLDSDPAQIENHIRQRPASEREIEQRLASFHHDMEQFYENRHDVPYSLGVEKLGDLRPNEDKTRVVLRELDAPLQQLRAITAWERHMASHYSRKPESIQAGYDLFVDKVTSLLTGHEAGEISDMLRSGQTVPLFADSADSLLENYRKNNEVSRGLLESIVGGVSLVGMFEGNGRRTLVLSPYEDGPRISDGETDKHTIVDLLRMRISGYGTVRARTEPGTHSSMSALSGMRFNFGVDEALFAHLSSDHIPIDELEGPRSVNVVFADRGEVMADDDARPLSLDEVASEVRKARLARRDMGLAARAFGIDSRY